MRDILGITDFKSGAAKTPPFRFESGYIHYSPLEGRYSSIFKSQIVLDIATQVSVREDMRPFHIDQFKSTTYDKEKPSVALEDIPGHKERDRLFF